MGAGCQQWLSAITSCARSHVTLPLAVNQDPKTRTPYVAHPSPVGPLTFPVFIVRCLFRVHDRKTEGAEVLLNALADSIGVYYNATGDLECFSPAAGANNASSIDADNWNWQVGSTRIVLKHTIT